MIAIAETKVIASAIPTVNQRNAPLVRKDSATTHRGVKISPRSALTATDSFVRFVE